MLQQLATLGTTLIWSVLQVFWERRRNSVSKALLYSSGEVENHLLLEPWKIRKKQQALLNYYLNSTMTGNNKEWIGNCKNHPNVNHLDVSCLWQWLGNAHKAFKKYEYAFSNQNLTHKVVKTRRRVVLTSMTISRNVLLNDVDIWLIKSSIPVGKNIVINWPVRGLLKLKSTKIPSLPYLSNITEF